MLETKAQMFFRENKDKFISYCRAKLYNFGCMNVIPHSEDIFNSIYERCSKISNKKFEDLNSPDAYFYKTIHHDCIKLSKSLSRLSDEEFDEQFNAKTKQNYTPQTLQTQEFAILLLEFQNTLEKEESKLFELRVFEGLSHSEIASLLSITTDASRTRFSRLRKKIISFFGLEKYREKKLGER